MTSPGDISCVRSPSSVGRSAAKSGCRRTSSPVRGHLGHLRRHRHSVGAPAAHQRLDIARGGVGHELRQQPLPDQRPAEALFALHQPLRRDIDAQSGHLQEGLAPVVRPHQDVVVGGESVDTDLDALRAVCGCHRCREQSSSVRRVQGISDEIGGNPRSAGLAGAHVERSGVPVRQPRGPRRIDPPSSVEHRQSAITELVGDAVRRPGVHHDDGDQPLDLLHDVRGIDVGLRGVGMDADHHDGQRTVRIPEVRGQPTRLGRVSDAMRRRGGGPRRRAALRRRGTGPRLCLREQRGQLPTHSCFCAGCSGGGGVPVGISTPAGKDAHGVAEESPRRRRELVQRIGGGTMPGQHVDLDPVGELRRERCCVDDVAIRARCGEHHGRLRPMRGLQPRRKIKALGSARQRGDVAAAGTARPVGHGRGIRHLPLLHRVPPA